MSERAQRDTGILRSGPGRIAGRIPGVDLARGLAVPDAECPRPSGDGPNSRRALKSESDKLLAHIAAACAAHAIDPALVASRADADSYVQWLTKGTVVAPPLTKGWRQAFVAGFTP